MACSREGSIGSSRGDAVIESCSVDCDTLKLDTEELLIQESRDWDKQTFEYYKYLL